MNKCVLLIAFFVLLGCGAPDRRSSSAPLPAAPPSGPGTATAPDGVSIAYTVTGRGSPALVFIHGWMCDQSFWSKQVGAFAGRHTVVTVDLAGHGRSGMNRDTWSLTAFGGDVAAVVEQLGLEQIILVGHSMGGPVILETARLMPERVLGVVGVDTLRNVERKYNPERVKKFLAAMEKDFPGTCRGFVARMFLKGSDPALVERVVAAMCSRPPEVGIALTRSLVDYDARVGFAAVPAAIPVRCINSTARPTNVEGIRAYHEDFDVVTMDGVGHFLMMEKPAEFNACLKAVIEQF